MDFLRRNLKRILTDAAGYALLLAALLTGWLPGPGGIPLALAGLALLSINNQWAKDLREYLLKHGGKFVGYLFPKNKLVEFLYDFVAILLLVLVGILAWQHDALWKISLSIALFFIALFLALMNRDRWNRLRKK